tara:strand:- start:3323 stop:3568 length:246 start_codon:yes stop_codon:yes gene_type:complete
MRTRARKDISSHAKKMAKLGRVGMFEFSFTLVSIGGKGRSSSIVKEVLIKTDSYNEAILYANYNTPKDHQGLIDGLTVVVK